MKKEISNEELVKDLTRAIKKFEDKNWLKMTTRKDLAEYLIENGFSPSAKVFEYKKGILDILYIVNQNYDEEYRIIEEKGVRLLKDRIYQLIGEK